jgi:uncharacterized protein (TIGR04141 family)
VNAVGTGRPVPRERLELEYFLQRTRPRRAGTRVEALRKGRVLMNADDDGTEVLASTRADRWLEASLSDEEGRKFFYMDGTWYEIGDQYVRTSRDEITRLFLAQPSLDLPPWYLTNGRDEGDYNANVPCVRTGYVCLDKNKRVRDPLGPSRSSVEICDLLGPNGELVHVKRPRDPRRLATCSPRAWSQPRPSSTGRIRCGSSSPKRSGGSARGEPHRPATSRRRSYSPFSWRMGRS